MNDRLRLWVNLILTDFNMESIGEIMRQEGCLESDIDRLGMFGPFEFDGTPKPAMESWNNNRGK